MKVPKTARITARRIFRLCLVDGRLDEDRLGKAVRKLADSQPRGYRPMLSALKRLVRLELERRHVVVESAEELAAETRQQIERELTSQHGTDLQIEYRVRPDILGGLKIRVGNDVWDGTVKGRLDRLANAF